MGALRSVCFPSPRCVCQSCESLPPSSPLLCLLPPSCLLLLRNFSCMWFAVSPCAVSPRFMESWTRCHFQLPRIYSPDERMWDGELSDWDVKHLGFTNNKAGQSWRNIVQSCLVGELLLSLITARAKLLNQTFSLGVISAWCACHRINHRI